MKSRLSKLVVTSVAVTLCALLALTAGIITDLHDREFPQALGAQSRLTLDFSQSGLPIADAFATLEELDARWDLGLVKVAPALAREGDGQVFVAFNDTDLPAEFPWFGDGSGRVVGTERLANSLPDGFYLVTGAREHLGQLDDYLSSEGVRMVRADASVFDSLGFVFREGGFAAAVLAAFALIAALALFWLSTRARARALRVLGGCPTTRIHLQDLGGFAGSLLGAASVVSVAAVGYVGVAHGWVFTGAFLRALVGLQVAVIAVSLFVALVMSAAAWPSATMLARRKPAVRSLRTAAAVIQLFTFLLVVAAAGPAWTAYQRSTQTAAEVAQWRQLADQVTLNFAMGIDMDAVEPQIGEMVKDAEARDLVAHSLTFTERMWYQDFGEYSAISFVNQRWLDLVTTGAPDPPVVPIPRGSVPAPVLEGIREQAELWARHEPFDDAFAEFRFLRPVDGFRLPVMESAGGLIFRDDSLLVVVPSVYAAYDDFNATSIASGGYLMFTGVGETQRLLKRHGLDAQTLRERGMTGELRVVHLAEDGLLRAQFAEYVAWLLNLALVALVVAFTVAAAISALIAALLHARRDFALRLAGQSWGQVLASRVAKQLFGGAGLVVVVVLIQQPEGVGAVLVAAAIGLVVVPLSHALAARWCFEGVGRRRI